MSDGLDATTERDMSIAQRYAGFLQREAVNASTPVKGEAIRQAANKLLEIDQENHRLRADSDRLEWLLRNVSGQEFRRLGITYSAGCGRADIDSAMCEQDASI